MTINITQAGTYTLTADIKENIIVHVAGVTIEGNGHKVIGPGGLPTGIGILASAAATGLVVNDLTVTGWAAGIHAGGAGSTITDVVSYNNTIRGIGVAGGGA